MTLFKKIQFAFPQRLKRMEKVETLQLGPAQFLHLVRIDGGELLVAVGAGSPTISTAPAKLSPRDAAQ